MDTEYPFKHINCLLPHTSKKSTPTAVKRKILQERHEKATTIALQALDQAQVTSSNHAALEVGIQLELVTQLENISILLTKKEEEDSAVEKLLGALKTVQVLGESLLQCSNDARQAEQKLAMCTSSYIELVGREYAETVPSLKEPSTLQAVSEPDTTTTSVGNMSYNELHLQDMQLPMSRPSPQSQRIGESIVDARVQRRELAHKAGLPLQLRHDRRHSGAHHLVQRPVEQTRNQEQTPQVGRTETWNQGNQQWSERNEQMKSSRLVTERGEPPPAATNAWLAGADSDSDSECDAPHPAEMNMMHNWSVQTSQWGASWLSCPPPERSIWEFTTSDKLHSEKHEKFQPKLTDLLPSTVKESIGESSPRQELLIHTGASASSVLHSTEHMYTAPPPNSFSFSALQPPDTIDSTPTQTQASTFPHNFVGEIADAQFAVIGGNAWLDHPDDKSDDSSDAGDPLAVQQLNQTFLTQQQHAQQLRGSSNACVHPNTLPGTSHLISPRDPDDDANPASVSLLDPPSQRQSRSSHTQQPDLSRRPEPEIGVISPQTQATQLSMSAHRALVAQYTATKTPVAIIANAHEATLSIEHISVSLRNTVRTVTQVVLTFLENYAATPPDVCLTSSALHHPNGPHHLSRHIAAPLHHNAVSDPLLAKYLNSCYDLSRLALFDERPHPSLYPSQHMQVHGRPPPPPSPYTQDYNGLPRRATQGSYTSRDVFPPESPAWNPGAFPDQSGPYMDPYGHMVSHSPHSRNVFNHHMHDAGFTGQFAGQTSSRTPVESLHRNGQYSPGQQLRSERESLQCPPAQLSWNPDSERHFAALASRAAPSMKPTSRFLLSCSLCDVTSKSLKGLLAHLCSKGHNRRIQMQSQTIYMYCLAQLEHINAPKEVSTDACEMRILTDHLDQIPHARFAGPEMSDALLVLLAKVYGFQLRKMLSTPGTGLARAKKRCLGGLREASWAVKKPGRTALVLLASNIQVPSHDSVLMKEVVQLVDKCHQSGVPVVVSLTRKQLGSCFVSGSDRSYSRKSMSAVAILDISGAEREWLHITSLLAATPPGVHPARIPPTPEPPRRTLTEVRSMSCPKSAGMAALTPGNAEVVHLQTCIMERVKKGALTAMQLQDVHERVCTLRTRVRGDMSA